MDNLLNISRSVRRADLTNPGSFSYSNGTVSLAVNDVDNKHEVSLIRAEGADLFLGYWSQGLLPSVFRLERIRSLL